ncbi:zinc-dependent peptidase [Cytophagales bacterium LB-30]|uniref:Zinc-dependent peptidase n=1 Tax=Shiella aurantiaca TaxID=3058365 RepID=A0ABT8F766_9BACT|nr:zinc-dependent peptidase [Shiella aurantiaca]
MVLAGWTGQSRFKHSHHQVLERYFAYYQKLPLRKKQEFERRVANFVNSKEFISRGGLEITPMVETLVAACAVQLTFGLREIRFEHFDKIILYPTNFYSRSNDQIHKGEVNPRFGVIALSWKSFLEGYLDPSDAYNLGLHEMAHALKLENRIPNEEYQFLQASILKEIDDRYFENSEDLALGKPTLLRAYAGVNKEEFFAVAVENFFERPQEMKQHLPRLYANMSQLLGQETA